MSVDVVGLDAAPGGAWAGVAGEVDDGVDVGELGGPGVVVGGEVMGLDVRVVGVGAVEQAEGPAQGGEVAAQFGAEVAGGAGDQDGFGHAGPPFDASLDDAGCFAKRRR